MEDNCRVIIVVVVIVVAVIQRLSGILTKQGAIKDERRRCGAKEVIANLDLPHRFYVSGHDIEN